MENDRLVVSIVATKGFLVSCSPRDCISRPQMAFYSWDSRARQVIRKSQGVFLRGMSWLCSGALPARFLSRKLSEWRNY